jgi:GTPase SAR1 family protein
LQKIEEHEKKIEVNKIKKEFENLINSKNLENENTKENTKENTFISKLIFLGDGEVGKTSLCKRLKGEDFNLTEEQTDGVEISNKKYENKDKKNILFKFFDFAGQKDYHASHPIFFTT